MTEPTNPSPVQSPPSILDAVGSELATKARAAVAYALGFIQGAAGDHPEAPRIQAILRDAWNALDQLLGVPSTQVQPAAPEAQAPGAVLADATDAATSPAAEAGTETAGAAPSNGGAAAKGWGAPQGTPDADDGGAAAEAQPPPAEGSGAAAPW